MSSCCYLEPGFSYLQNQSANRSHTTWMAT